MGGVVTAVSRSARHTLVKSNEDKIRLVAGLGVEGDAHSGATVKHRSRLACFANARNLRQVHLLHAELHDELKEQGFAVSAGSMGENVTARSIDLLALPAGARLFFGDMAIVEVTGLRNPCTQLDRIQRGLMGATLERGQGGSLVRTAGIMAVVLAGGDVRPGDPIRVELPEGAVPAAVAGLGTCLVALSKAAPGGMLRRLLKRCAHHGSAAAMGLFGSTCRPRRAPSNGFRPDH